MHEQFSKGARKAMQLANQEAQRLDHPYIGVEHILLGLLKEGTGAELLKKLGLSLPAVREEAEQVILIRAATVATGRLPHTRRAKRVIEIALEVARSLGDTTIEPAHILMGVLYCDDAPLASALKSVNVDPEEARKVVLKEMIAQRGKSVQSMDLG